MNVSAGRDLLAGAEKDFKAIWESSGDDWDDRVRQRIEEEELLPLFLMTRDALQAIDRFAVILHQLRRDCE